jgi:F0F1-type ATP synthase beta subunit
MATTTKNKARIGTISQIVGVVIDVDFQDDNLPEIYNALKTTLMAMN